MKPIHLVLMIAMNVLWASSYSIFKWLGAHLESGVLVTYRYLLAVLCLFAVWPWLPGKSPRGAALARCLVMGMIVFCLAPRLQVEGVHRGRAGDGSVLMALDPLVTSLAAALFLGERIVAQRWVGFGLGMLGVGFISGVWGSSVHLPNLVANLLIIASFVCESAFSVMGKPLLERVGLHKVVAFALCGATATNLAWDGPAALAAAPGLPVAGWWMLVYLAVVLTVIGFCLWYVVIRENDVNVVALTIFVQPVAGLLVAILWLGETPHWGQLWGSLAIVAGLMIGLRERNPPSVPASNGHSA